MNNIEQHYGELTSEITMNGITPDANSMPMNKMFLGKKFQKIIKNSTHTIDSVMNVIYEKPQSFENGEVYEWELQGLVLSVYVIECKQLFVKGKHFWAYNVGIIE
ncbi:hypothetical protein EKTHUN627_24580 [Enterobacter kobei]|uniref:hypothetical protein n=1 Tax=Enterobacter kobei TaxID=208224 RepID=UPI0019158F30|nr:hypothetical protein [Enterobacter kobei]GHS71659.1 hypothetical protein EKTHUN627_24580 [Enterobacter kobei]